MGEPRNANLALRPWEVRSPSPKTHPIAPSSCEKSDTPNQHSKHLQGRAADPQGWHHLELTISRILLRLSGSFKDVFLWIV